LKEIQSELTVGQINFGKTAKSKARFACYHLLIKILFRDRRSQND